RVVSSENRYAIEGDSLNGLPVWRLVAERQRPGDSARQLDSLWVSKADFGLLRHTIIEEPYRSFGRIEVHQHMAGGRLSGDMNAYRSGLVVAHRTFDRVLGAEHGPYLADVFAWAYQTGVQLDSAWRGSVSLLGWAVRDNDVFVAANLRVEGED